MNVLKLQDLQRQLLKNQEITNRELQRLVELLSSCHFDEDFEHRAYFNPRLKTTGGRYHLTSHDVDFNKLIFEEYGLEEFKKVILHELCHYHLHIKGAGYRHRDKEFRTLLKKVGGSRFTPPLSAKAGVKVIYYSCQQCGQIYKRQRRVAIEKYGCRCGGRLNLER